MTRMLRATLIAAAAAVLAAGCASQQEPQVQRAQPTDPGYGPVIGDVKDGRTRAKAHTDLAAAYYELGNLGVALEEARIALAADPSYPPAYNVQGLVSMELKDQAGADASFQRGLKLAPQDPDLNHNYGWFLCQTGREQQSIQWFMNAIKNPLYPTPSKSYAAAGRCLQKGNPAESAQYLERALRLDPNTVQAMMPYAEYLYRRGQLTPGEGARRALQQDAARADARVAVARAADRAQARRSPGRGEPRHPAAPAVQQLERVPVAPPRRLRLTMSDSATPVQPDEPQSPGRLLAAARQARGLTVTEVALRLKFSPRQIEALEADHYDVLRGPPMVRGMIRAYAKLIGAESGPLLDALQRAAQRRAADDATARDGSAVPARDAQGLARST